MIRKKRVYKGLFKEALYDIRQNLYRYIFFEMFYKGLNLVFILPLLIYFFDKLMISLGINSLISKEYLILGISISEILGGCFIAFIASAAIFIELGTLTVLSHKSVFKKDISIFRAFFITIKKVPLLFGVGSLHLFLYFLIVVPFVGMTTDTPVLKYVAIPKFIQEEIFNSNLFAFLYIILVIVLSFIYIRWIFVVNYIIYNNSRVSDALKKSKRIAKGYYLNMFLVAIIANLLLPTIATIGVFVISIIVAYAGNIFGLNLLFLGFDEYFSVFGDRIFLVLSMLASPLSTILITKIFIFRKKCLNDPIVDNIPDYKIHSVNIKMRNIATIIAILVFVLVSTFTTLNDIDYKIHNNNIKVAAHRGDIEQSPENTLPAIESSINKGADYVEVDIQRTKDDKIVLFHDKSLFRLTGVNKRVKDLTYEEIKNLNIKSHYLIESKKEKIPSLEEALMLSKGKIGLLLDVKTYGKSDGFANELLSILEMYDMKENILIQSSEYKVLQDIRNIDPNIKIGYIAYIVAGDIYSLDVDFYSIEQSILSKNAIKKIRSMGKDIWVWTVNDSVDIFSSLRKDIDGIITDKIIEVKDQINEMKSR